MNPTVARIFAVVIEGYALIGVAFAIVFLPRAVLRLDPRLAESALSVRVVLLPGIAALWPLFLWRWIAHRPAPLERNAHRDAAARAGTKGRT
jgi:hypothetical protein